jgi:hypothetical protein
MFELYFVLQKIKSIKKVGNAKTTALTPKIQTSKEDEKTAPEKACRRRPKSFFRTGQKIDTVRVGKSAWKIQPNKNSFFVMIKRMVEYIVLYLQG